MSLVDQRLLVDEERHSNQQNQDAQLHPQLGYQVVPQSGTEPKRIIMEALQFAILKKLEEASSTYIGPTNDKGERHGQGKITYIDGSTYEGTFFNGLRHGEGVSRSKEGEYSGEFSHDMKDGKGELKLPNGDRLKGSWRNDKKDGDFEFISIDSQQTTQRLYFNDVEINMADQNPDNFDRAFWNLFFLALAIGMYFLYLLVKGHFKKDYAPLIFSIVCLIVYFADSFTSKTFQYLRKTRTLEQIKNYIEEGKAKTPIIEWQIECYHGGQNGEKRHSTYQFNKCFAFYEWSDKTPDTSNLEYFKRYPFVRLTFGVQTEMTPPASHSYEIQEKEFKESSKRDIYQEFTTKKRFDGLEVDMTMLTGSRPILFYPFFYVLFTLVGLSWLYRIMFTLSTRRANFDFHKLILK